MNRAFSSRQPRLHSLQRCPASLPPSRARPGRRAHPAAAAAAAPAIHAALGAPPRGPGQGSLCNMCAEGGGVGSDPRAPTWLGRSSAARGGRGSSTAAGGGGARRCLPGAARVPGRAERSGAERSRRRGGDKGGGGRAGGACLGGRRAGGQRAAAPGGGVGRGRGSRAPCRQYSRVPPAQNLPWPRWRPRKSGSDARLSLAYGTHCPAGGEGAAPRGGGGPSPDGARPARAPSPPRGAGPLRPGWGGGAGYITPPEVVRGKAGGFSRERGGGICPGSARRRRALRLGPERELAPRAYPSAAAGTTSCPEGPLAPGREHESGAHGPRDAPRDPGGARTLVPGRWCAEEGGGAGVRAQAGGGAALTPAPRSRARAGGPARSTWGARLCLVPHEA